MLCAVLLHAASEWLGDLRQGGRDERGAALPPLGRRRHRRQHSHAVADGDYAFLAGQLAVDAPAGAPADIGTETRVSDGAPAAGARRPRLGLGDLVRTNVYLRELADFEAMDAEYAAAFGDVPLPARTCVQVAALIGGCRVEIDRHRAPAPSVAFGGGSAPAPRARRARGRRRRAGRRRARREPRPRRRARPLDAVAAAGPRAPAAAGGGRRAARPRRPAPAGRAGAARRRERRPRHVVLDRVRVRALSAAAALRAARASGPRPRSPTRARTARATSSCGAGGRRRRGGFRPASRGCARRRAACSPRSAP